MTSILPLSSSTARTESLESAAPATDDPLLSNGGGQPFSHFLEAFLGGGPGHLPNVGRDFDSSLRSLSVATTHVEFEASATRYAVGNRGGFDFPAATDGATSLVSLDERLEDLAPGLGDQFTEIGELFERLAPSVGELFSQLLAHIMNSLEKETEFWSRHDCGRVQACHQSTRVALEASFIELRAELNDGTVIEAQAMRLTFEAHFEASGVSRFLPAGELV